MFNSGCICVNISCECQYRAPILYKVKPVDLIRGIICSETYLSLFPNVFLSTLPYFHTKISADYTNCQSPLVQRSNISYAVISLHIAKQVTLLNFGKL